MKEKDAKINSDKYPVVLYVEKPDGTYGTLQTGAHMPVHYLDDYIGKLKYLEQAARKRMAEGTASALALFVDVRMMTIPDLAARTGIPAGTVKKHLTPKFFERMTVAQLKRYADVLGIPAPALLDPPREITLVTPKKDDA